MTDREFINKVNDKPKRPLIAQHAFTANDYNKAKGIARKYNLDYANFLNNASLNDKMIISKLLETGLFDNEVPQVSTWDQWLNTEAFMFADMLLRPWVCIDTRGLITIDPLVGKTINLSNLEKRLNTNFETRINKDYCGYDTQAGMILRRLFNLA